MSVDTVLKSALPRRPCHCCQIGWFTCDGAAVNGTTLRELENKVDGFNLDWSAQDHHIL